jgi:tetratricopeptide (TPR) repeat protein
MARRYFEGLDPDWADITTGFGIRRLGFRGRLMEELQGVSESKAVVVYAAAGSGKSTAIRSLAIDLSRTLEFEVYFTNNPGGDDTLLRQEIGRILQSAVAGRLPVVIIDGAASSIDIVKKVASRYVSYPILWILCDRTERWAGALGHKVDERITPNTLGVKNPVPRIHLPPLDDDERACLVDHLVDWGVLSDAAKTREEWVELFNKRYGGQLLVTLLMIQDEGGGVMFRERLRNEAENFGDIVRKKVCDAQVNPYPAVAALYRFGIAPTRKWVLSWFKSSGSVIDFNNENALDRAIDAKVLIADHMGRIKCRHEIIADVVTEEVLGRSDKLLRVYEAWVKYDANVKIEQEHHLVKLFAGSEIRTKLSFNHMRALYGSLEECLPKNKYLNHAHAMLLQVLGDNAGVEAQFKKAIENNPTNGPTYQAYALFLEKRKRDSEAEEQFKKGIENDPTHGALYQAYALFLEKRKRDVEAEAQFKKGIENDPTNGPTYQAYALFLEKRKRDSEAEAQFKKGIENAPTHASLYQAYALFLEKRKRDVEAEEQFKKGIEKDPANAHLYQANALFLEKRKRDSEAEEQFIKGIEKDPTNAHLYQAYALFLEKRKRDSEAEAQFKKGIEKDPTDAHLYQAYALFLEKRKRDSEAEAQFKKGIENDPTNAHLYQANALFLAARKCDSEAEAQFKKGIENDPTHAHLYQAYALFLERAKRYQEAETQFIKGIENNPVNAPLYQDYARFLRNAGRHPEAEAQFKKGIDNDPADAPLRNELTLFYFNLGYKRCALDCGREGLDKADVDVHLTNAVAKVMWLMYHYDEAIKLLEEGWRLIKQNKETNKNTAHSLAVQGDVLTRYHAMMGNTDKARPYLEEALINAPDDGQLIGLKKNLDGGQRYFRIPLEGKLLTPNQTGCIINILRDKKIAFISQQGAKPDIYTPMSNIKNMPDSAWAVGTEVIFDLWEQSNGKPMAVNVELPQWGWNVGSTPVITPDGIKPVPRDNVRNAR